MSVKCSEHRQVVCAASFFLCLILLGQVVFAAQPQWPKKSGELCWEADAFGEISRIVVLVTNMGGGHYLLHGRAYRVINGTLGDLQPINGNAEIEGNWVVGQLSKIEINILGNPDWFESFSGMVRFDLNNGLAGTAQGVISYCDITQPYNPQACIVELTDVIPLTLIPCP